MTLWMLFRQSKASKLADHHPMILKNHSGQRHFPALWSQLYSLSRMNLPSTLSSLMKTLLKRLIIPSCSPHGALSSYIPKKRWLSLTLCWLPSLQLNSTRKDHHPLAHFQPPKMQPWKARATPRFDLLAGHTPSYDFTWRQIGRLHINPLWLHLSGW